MAGNAAEEGLMMQIGNPSHLDSGRIVVPAAALSGYAAGYLVWRLIPAVTFGFSLIVGIITCGLVAWKLAAWFAARREARELEARETERAAQIARTERQLATMRRAAAKAKAL